MPDTLGPGMWIIVYLFLLHIIGDLGFLRKAHSFDSLFLHAFIYCLILWGGVYILQRWSIDEVCRFTIVNFFLHLLVDYITLRVSTWGLTVKKDTSIFVRAFGIDQVVHVTILILTCEYLLMRW